MTFVRALLVMLALVAILACAARGPDVSVEDVKRVRLGMTKSDVIQVMGGPPNSVHEDVSGELSNC